MTANRSIIYIMVMRKMSGEEERLLCREGGLAQLPRRVVFCRSPLTFHSISSMHERASSRLSWPPSTSGQS